MAVFAYKGTGAGGEKRTGEVEAGSRSEALRRLALDRIQPLSLVVKSEMAGPSGPTTAARGGRHGAGPVRLRNKDLILFTDELADFINSACNSNPRCS